MGSNHHLFINDGSPYITKPSVSSPRYSHDKLTFTSQLMYYDSLSVRAMLIIRRVRISDSFHILALIRIAVIIRQYRLRRRLGAVWQETTTWANVKNGETGDLRHHRAYYDATVMYAWKYYCMLHVSILTYERACLSMYLRILCLCLFIL